MSFRTMSWVTRFWPHMPEAAAVLGDTVIVPLLRDGIEVDEALRQAAATPVYQALSADEQALLRKAAGAARKELLGLEVRRRPSGSAIRRAATTGPAQSVTVLEERGTVDVDVTDDRSDRQETLSE